MRKSIPGAKHILYLIVIGGVIGLSACTSVALAQPKGNLEAQVSTAVAATLVQRLVETRVAEQAVALVTQPAAQATQPPTPTPTQVPTQPPPPTAAPTLQAAQPTPTPTLVPASGPEIIADQDTNCRAGPDTGYQVLTYFLEGAKSTVEGRDQGKDWWYIVNPTTGDGYCWVWDGSTTVVGDTSAVPVVAAPASQSYQTSQWYAYNPYYTYYPCYPGSSCYPYNAGWWKKFCKQNPGYCKQIDWGTCNPYITCTCKPVYSYPCTYPCKKSSCPPVTEVNYKNYCSNYPQCCDD